MKSTPCVCGSIANQLCLIMFARPESETERTVASYSLHVLRNFGIMTSVSVALATQAQVLSRGGNSQSFRTGYSIAGTAMATLIQLTALIYVYMQESFNRRAAKRFPHPYDAAPGAAVPASVLTLLVLIWYALFIGLFFGLEINAV